jgi:hypothetical protein
MTEGAIDQTTGQDITKKHKKGTRIHTDDEDEIELGSLSRPNFFVERVARSVHLRLFITCYTYRMFLNLLKYWIPRLS